MSEAEPFKLSFNIDSDVPEGGGVITRAVTIGMGRDKAEDQLWVVAEANGFDATAVGAEDVCVFLEDIIASIRTENAEHLGAVPEQPKRFNPQPVSKKPEGWRKG